MSEALALDVVTTGGGETVPAAAEVPAIFVSSDSGSGGDGGGEVAPTDTDVAAVEQEISPSDDISDTSSMKVHVSDQSDSEDETDGESSVSSDDSSSDADSDNDQAPDASASMSMGGLVADHQYPPIDPDEYSTSEHETEEELAALMAERPVLASLLPTPEQLGGAATMIQSNLNAVAKRVEDTFSCYPNSLGLTYKEHFLYSTQQAMWLVVAGLALFIHAVFPFWLQDAAPKMVDSCSRFFNSLYLYKSLPQLAFMTSSGNNTANNDPEITCTVLSERRVRRRR